MNDRIIKYNDNEWYGPEWAKEETLEAIKNYSQGSFGVLENIFKQISNDDKKSNNVLNSIRKEIRLAARTDKENNTSSNNTDNKNSKSIKESIERQTERIKHQTGRTDHLGMTIERGFNRLNNSLSDNIGSFGDSVSGVVNSITGVVSGISSAFGPVGRVVGGVISGIGAVASSVIGMMFGILDEFSNSLIDLSNTGASFGVSLVSLRDAAADAGMTMRDFSSLISENSSALRGLASTTADGIILVADQIQTVLGNIDDEFNYFGMTVRELNENMLYEIDLRRRTNQLLTTSTYSLVDGMQELLFQTTAMSILTAQDRRELMRTRQQSLSDELISSYRTTLLPQQQQAYDSLYNLSEIAGETLMGAFESAMVTGNIPNVFEPYFMQLLDTHTGGLGTQMFADFNQGVLSGEDQFEVQRRMLIQFAEVADSLSNTEIQDLVQRATYMENNGNTEYATAIRNFVGMVQRTQGLQTAVSAQGLNFSTMTRQDFEDLIRSSTAAGTPARLETAVNTIRASAFQMFDDLIPGGMDISSGLNNILTQVEEDFRDENGDIVALPDAIQNMLSGFLGIEIQGSMHDRLIEIRDILELAMGNPNSLIYAALGAIAGGTLVSRAITMALATLTTGAATATSPVGLLAGSALMASAGPAGMGSSITEQVDPILEEMGLEPGSPEWWAERERQIDIFWQQAYEAMDQLVGQGLQNMSLEERAAYERRVRQLHDEPINSIDFGGGVEMFHLSEDQRSRFMDSQPEIPTVEARAIQTMGELMNDIISMLERNVDIPNEEQVVETVQAGQQVSQEMLDAMGPAGELRAVIEQLNRLIEVQERTGRRMTTAIEESGN